MGLNYLTLFEVLLAVDGDGVGYQRGEEEDIFLLGVIRYKFCSSEVGSDLCATL